MRTKFGILLLATSLCVPALVGAAEKTATPEVYTKWLNDLKEEMIERGISKKTIDLAYGKNDYYHPDPEVVKIDRKQIEFVLTSTEYLNRVVNAKKVAKAREKYKQLYPLFKDMEKKYGVQINYLIAFWGMETNFGQNFGNYEVIDALTTLSYDKRRPKFFKEELFQALTIIDKWQVEPKQMEGSWAGAMGHFQFMPSTFNAYAVDYNGDGKIDIWHSFEDAIASAANYLSSMGWQAGQDWGEEVSLPWNFDYALSGRQYQKTIKEWRKLGVRGKDGKPLKLKDEWKASIILPEGKKGHAYLITDNFRKIMVWNRSENYALAVGMLADYIKTGKKWQPMTQNAAVKVKSDDVVKVQSFINRLGWGKLDEDGKLGSKTREAIKKVQAEAKMPQDGYPDYQFLQKINRYNPKVGFAIPVQPRREQKDDVQKQKQSLRTEKKKLN